MLRMVQNATQYFAPFYLFAPLFYQKECGKALLFAAKKYII